MLCSADSRRRKRDQPIDGREPHGELPADDDAARVGDQTGQVEAHLPENDSLEHDAIKSIRSALVVIASRKTLGSSGALPTAHARSRADDSRRP